ncbi:MAG: VOC family protein [Mycobacterium kyogaense]|uniref:VOC family protein n=1 Tax=Mycobacterium kyogaense TaxID=2212479 RepID=UPI002FF47A0D
MPGIEVGLVTTNLDAMTAFYEGFLELEPQGEIAFSGAGGGGSQRRYTLGTCVLKLVTYDAPPAPAVPGGGRTQAGLRYFTIGVTGLRDVAAAFEASPYEIVEGPTEFAPVPGMGFMFVADPDGNHIELFGTL